VTGPVHVQQDEQEVDFSPTLTGGTTGGEATRPDEGAGDPVAPPAGAADAHHAGVAPADVAPAPAAREHEHPSAVVVDPDGLHGLARALHETGRELRDAAVDASAAIDAPGLPAELRSDLADRVRELRAALEALARELEEEGRDLEVRGQMIAELEQDGGASHAEVVKAVFATPVTPVAPPPSGRTAG
jgi:hypothetical protein